MKKLTLLSLLFLSLFACRNDIDETLSEEVVQDPTETILIDYNPIIEPVTGTLFGIVQDEAGNPLEGVSVRLEGDNPTTTDEGGRFVYKDLTMNQNGTFVRATSGNYFPGSHRFFPSEGSVNYATITLMERTNTGSFEAGDGGVITDASGIKIEFSSNSIAGSNGDAYNGTVEVAARFIDPTADNLDEIMPGDLQGVRVTNGEFEEVALGSAGMMAVELESPSGEALNILEGKTATLTFPVPAEILANAPAEIPLWSFNETYGIWVQEGTATLDGNNYVGEVSHFSFWNCDYPYPLIELEGRVITENDVPVQWAQVKLTMVNGGWPGYATTNGDGEFGGKVPKDEEFVMEVSMYDGCGGYVVLYTANVGPFDVDTDLGDIVISLPSNPTLIEITGTVVDCNGDAVDNGFVSISLDGGYEYTYYIDDGTLSATINNCVNATSVTVIATDIDGLEQSGELTFTITNPLDLGQLDACGNVLPEYFNVTIDGVTTAFFDPAFYNESGFDSTQIYSGFNQNNDFNLQINMSEITGTGIYDANDITNFWFFLPGDNNYYFSSCQTLTPGGDCDLTIDVTQHAANVGDTMIGTFTGSAEVSDSIQGTQVLPFTGEFKIIRD